MFTPSYNRGVIADLVKEIPEADFDISSDDSQGQVEIIGWLYQYYNQEPKDAAFKKRNYTQGDIPAVTQLFTPDWIVKYLVENSIGRVWINHLQANGDERTARDLAQSFGWQYFMPDAKQPENVQVKIATGINQMRDLAPQDISIIDPAMGSGHILVYAFTVLEQIYVSEGYSKREAARQILAQNLYGADIDNRAFQLTYFAMMMKARQYDRSVLDVDIEPHVFDIPEVNWSQDDLQLLTRDSGMLNKLKSIGSLFHHGDELGSLIEFNLGDSESASLRKLTKHSQPTGQLSFASARREIVVGQLREVLQVLDLLDRTYTVSVTNPPYMGSGKMPADLAKFVKKHYPNSKSDLFAVFMERLHSLTVKNGYYAMITQHQWMFLSSFESLRKSLARQTFINMAHLGTRAFEEIGGEVVQSVAFVIKNATVNNFVGTYERLVDFNSQDTKELAYLNAVKEPQLQYVYRANQANFAKIPGSPVAYWASKNDVAAFANNPKLGSIAPAQRGLTTGDNNKFLRSWWEVSFNDIGIGYSSSEAKASAKRWFPYNKGGRFRNWYGNKELIVDYSNDGGDIRQNGITKHKSFGFQGSHYYFSPGITWTALTSGHNSFRYSTTGSLFDSNKGPMLFPSAKDTPIILALLVSPISSHFFRMLNPTLSLQNGDVDSFPINIKVFKIAQSSVPKRCIEIAKDDYDYFEISWDFENTQLLRFAEHTLTLLRKIRHKRANVPILCQIINYLKQRSVYMYG